MSAACRCYDLTTICSTIPTLVEVCRFEAKAFSATDHALKHFFDAECFTDDYFPYLKLFLSSVRYLGITYDEEQLHPGWKNILVAICYSTHCKLNELQIYQSGVLYIYMEVWRYSVERRGRKTELVMYTRSSFFKFLKNTT